MNKNAKHQLASSLIHIVYSSDLHGNLKQYEALVKYANDHRAQVLCIGGDLFPKSRTTNKTLPPYPLVKTVGAQREYFQKKILPILQQFHNRVYISFGNADFYANVNHLNQLCTNTNVTIVNSRVVKLEYNNQHDVESAENTSNTSNNNINGGLYLLGYAGVPFSRHKLKDFERFDTVDPRETLETRDREYLSLDGFASFISDEQFQTELLLSNDVGFSLNELQQRSPHVKHKYGEGAYCIQFPEDNLDFIRSFCIESQMKQILADADAKADNNKIDRKKMIWMCHAPPLDTCLDVTKHKTHVGSLALRRLILDEQPLLTLHGHIHETVDMNDGKYREQLGSTVCCGSGNYPNTLKVAIINCFLSPSGEIVETTRVRA